MAKDSDKAPPSAGGKDAPKVKPKAKPRADRRKKAFMIFAAMLGVMMLLGLMFQGMMNSHKQQSKNKNSASQHVSAALPPPPSTSEATQFLASSAKTAPSAANSDAGAGGSGSSSGNGAGTSNRSQGGHGFFPSSLATQAKSAPNKDVTGGYGLNEKEAHSGIFAFGANGGGNMKPPPSDVQNLNTQIKQAKKLIEERQNLSAKAQGDKLNNFIKKVMASSAARNGGGGGSSGGAGPTAEQRSQSNSKFLKNPGVEQANTSKVSVTPPPKLPTLMPGSVIPAVLVSTINSDLPGQIVARTTSPVYDSIHERTLIIPIGSTLVGYYSSNVSSGQTRVLASFKKVIFPNGTTVNLGGMSAADAYGQAGMGADVNSHFWKRFGASFLVAALSSLLPQSQYVTVINAGRNPSNALSNAAGQTLNNIAQSDLQRYQNLAPTLIVHRGFRFNVMVSKSISLTGVERGQ